VSLMRRWWLGVGLVAPVGLLVGSVAFAVGQSRNPPLSNDARMDGSSSGWGSPGPGMMVGPGVMGGGGATMGTVWLSGNGVRVASIGAARDRVAVAGRAAGLHPGEVIWFDNGFYVELKDATGNPATEVIIDPAGGTVTTEPGPAMMWNTRYGMHRLGDGSTRSATINPAQAQQLAAAWLAAHRPDRVAAPPDSYPGYYTMETTTGAGTVNGMMSVNANTGQVWYHSWHGRFLGKDDA